MQSYTMNKVRTMTDSMRFAARLYCQFSCQDQNHHFLLHFNGYILTLFDHDIEITRGFESHKPIHPHEKPSKCISHEIRINTRIGTACVCNNVTDKNEG